MSTLSECVKRSHTVKMKKTTATQRDWWADAGRFGDLPMRQRQLEGMIADAGAIVVTTRPVTE